MSDTDNDGGPAFPRPSSVYTRHEHLDGGQEPVFAQDGMSLLDYFASHALIGILANPERRGADPSDYAEMAYRQSNAMLMWRKVYS